MWYRPGKVIHPSLIKNSGRLLNKNSEVTWFQDVVYEKDTPPEGQELVLVVDGEAPAASSGGPVWNRQHQLVGIVLMRECEGCDLSKFISIDGIRRFLAEKE